MKNNFAINCSGGGTKKEIIEALKDLIRSIEATPISNLDGRTFEDPYLCTEISDSL